MAPLTPMSLPVEKIMEISIPHRYSCCSHAPLITISLFMLHFHESSPPWLVSCNYVVKAPGLFPPPTTGLSPSASTTPRPDSSCLVSGPSAAFSCTWPRVIACTPLKGYGLLGLTRLRHLTRSTAIAPNTATDPTPTPIPIPTFAPADREESRGCDAETNVDAEGADAAVVEEG